MSEREPIAKLCPRAKTTEEKRVRRALEVGIFRTVVAAIVADRNPADMLLELYLAGVWHGSELMRQRAGLSVEEMLALTPIPDRVIDRIDVTEPPKPRRGRPRKVET